MSEKTEEIVFIPIANIHVVDGRNRRFDFQERDHTQLIDSILERGVIKPIEVQISENGYDLVDGHRRHAACIAIEEKYDKIPEVNGRPVTHIRSTVVDLKTEADVLAHMLVSNDSKPFKPLEEAAMILELKNQTEKDAKGLAKMIGKSTSHVSDRLALLGAANEIKEAIEDKSLTVSDATTIVRKSHGSETEQKKYVEKVKKEGPQVIKKELTKGRYKKDQWEVAEKVWDDCSAALVAPETFVRVQVTDPNNVTEIIEQIFKNPNLEVAFQLGKMLGIGELGHLSPAEILNKLTLRVGGVEGVFTEDKKET